MHLAQFVSTAHCYSELTGSQLSSQTPINLPLIHYFWELIHSFSPEISQMTENSCTNYLDQAKMTYLYHYLYHF